MIKAAAAFVQNILDPMLDKFSDVIWLMESKGLPFDRDNLSFIFNRLLRHQIIVELIRAVCQVICFLIVLLIVINIL